MLAGLAGYEIPAVNIVSKMRTSLSESVFEAPCGDMPAYGLSLSRRREARPDRDIERLPVSAAGGGVIF